MMRQLNDWAMNELNRGDDDALMKAKLAIDAERWFFHTSGESVDDLIAEGLLEAGDAIPSRRVGGTQALTRTE